MSTARSYGVEGQIRELLDVRKELNGSGLEPSECVAGSRVVKILRDLDVNEERFSDFVHSVYTEVQAQGLKPQAFVSSCTELRRLREQTGKGYQAILDDYENKHEVNERLEAENAKLEDERRQLKIQLLQEVKDKEATLETLAWFNATKETLEGYGVEVEELDRLGIMLHNVSERSYDTDNVIDFYSQTRELEKSKISLEGDVRSLTDDKASLEERNSSLKHTIEGNQVLVESIVNIESMDLSVENIRGLLQKVTDVSSRLGIDRIHALEKFSADIDEQYEAKLGFENELNRLQARKERLDNEIDDVEAKLSRLEKIETEKKGVLDRLVSLNDRGVKNEDLVHWDEILSETELDLITVRREMAELGGLRQWFKSKLHEKGQLEGKVEALQREIESLRIQKENYESEVRSLTTGALAEAKEELARIPGIIDELRTDFLDSETGLQAKSLVMIDNTHAKIEKLLAKKEGALKKFFKNANGKVEEIDTKMNEILRVAYDAGKEVGRYAALEPVHRLESGEDIPLYVGLLAIYRMTVHFRNWFLNHGLKDCLRDTNRLIGSVERELHNSG